MQHLSPMRGRIGMLVCLTVLAAVMAGCGQAYQFAGTPFVPPLDAPPVNGAIRSGEAFALRKLPVKVKLVFFGYTSCPDICPLTMSNLKSVYDQLSPAERSNVAVVLISVDPARDTPERLASYTAAFNPEFYGVHVPEAQLAQLLDAFNVFAGTRSVEGADDPNSYLVDHTAVIFVVDTKNQLREIFPSNAPADQIAADVRYLLTE